MRLRRSKDSEPGFSRIRRGKGWSYHKPGGKKITDEAVIARLNALAVPPAYEDVWYCRDEKGHVQATGIDAKGRKQYRYHDDFRAFQEQEKFASCAEFGRALPRIRRRIARDLRKRKLARATVLAAIVKLIDTEYLRIGNRQYAKSNKSFGATTLTNRHVERLKTRLKINFKGKHGVERDVTITDPSLVRIVGECHELPGQSLFQYVTDTGAVRQVDSQDVNNYLRAISGGHFTAKQFRTWGGSSMAMEEIFAAKEAGEKLTVKRVIEPVAESLGNTPAVTRSSYIHPDILEEAKTHPGDAFERIRLPKRKKRGLTLVETQLIAFLERDAPRRRKRDKLKNILIRNKAA